MPRLQETDLAKAAGSNEAKTGVRCDGFHPHVPLGLTRETKGEAVEFLEKVAQCGRWPQQACTTMFFLIPKNVPNERPIALVLTMIRWWEALRAPEVAEWPQQYRIGWDATDGPNGAAERTVWETLQEMERFNDHAGERSSSGSPGLRLGESFRAGQSSSGLGVGDAFQIFHEDFAGATRALSSTSGEVGSKDVRRIRSRPITAILPGSKWSCLLLRIVLQDALSDVTKIYPLPKLRVFVDDITAFMNGRNKGLVEMAEKVLKSIRIEVEERGLEVIDY